MKTLTPTQTSTCGNYRATLHPDTCPTAQATGANHYAITVEHYKPVVTYELRETGVFRIQKLQWVIEDNICGLEESEVENTNDLLQQQLEQTIKLTTV